MTHAAIQIRDVMVNALTNLATTADRVRTRAKPARGEADLPDIIVALGPDEIRQVGTGNGATLIVEQEIHLTYRVKEKDDAEATAWQIDCEARKALADNLLGGLLQRIVPGPGMPDAEQLDVPCYALTRVMRVQYHTRVTTPDITT
jgi:hypothetical protein